MTVRLATPRQADKRGTYERGHAPGPQRTAAQNVSPSVFKLQTARPALTRCHAWLSRDTSQEYETGLRGNRRLQTLGHELFIFGSICCPGKAILDKRSFWHHIGERKKGYVVAFIQTFFLLQLGKRSPGLQKGMNPTMNQHLPSPAAEGRGRDRP